MSCAPARPQRDGQRQSRPAANSLCLRRAEAPAALVALGTQQLQGSFTPQAFTLCPWEPRTVHFTSSAQAPLAREELLQDISFMSVQQAMA